MKLILRCLVLLPILTTDGVASAQALEASRLELGAEAGPFGAIGEGLYVRPAIGPRVTVNLTRRDAVELSADTIVPNDYSQTYGLYFVQYKRKARPTTNPSRIRPFFTAGTGGPYWYRQISERRVERLDGSVVVYPAHATGELRRFSMITIGGGFERRINRHVSFRLDAGGFAVVQNDGYLGFRAVAGVSLPVGGYRAGEID